MLEEAQNVRGNLVENMNASLRLIIQNYQIVSRNLMDFANAINQLLEQYQSLINLNLIKLSAVTAYIKYFTQYSRMRQILIAKNIIMDTIRNIVFNINQMNETWFLSHRCAWHISRSNEVETKRALRAPLSYLRTQVYISLAEKRKSGSRVAAEIGEFTCVRSTLYCFSANILIL